MKKRFLSFSVMVQILVGGAGCLLLVGAWLYTGRPETSGSAERAGNGDHMPAEIEDKVMHICDRHRIDKELGYYFYSDKCFITQLEFSPKNRKTVRRKLFFVNHIDSDGWLRLSQKFVRRGISPPWLPVPSVVVELYYRGDVGKRFAFFDGAIYQTLLSDLEKLAAAKREIQNIPDFFLHPQNKKLLQIIQFVPERNYP